MFSLLLFSAFMSFLRLSCFGRYFHHACFVSFTSHYFVLFPPLSVTVDIHKLRILSTLHRTANTQSYAAGFERRTPLSERCISTSITVST